MMEQNPRKNCAVPPPADLDLAARVRPEADAPIVLHDIRNHLHAAVGLVELMSAGVMHIETHDAIDVARQSLQAVLAKLELLRVDLPGSVADGARADDVDCVRFASMLCAAFSVMARQHGATLWCQPDSADLHGRVDALALNRVLSNLVVNAIRHSRASAIEVCVRGDASGIVFLVRDNGIGPHDDVKDALQHLQSGRPAPAGYARLGLRSCIQSAALAGARLRLVNEWSPGVCWELALGPAEPARRPGRAAGPEARLAALLDL